MLSDGDPNVPALPQIGISAGISITKPHFPFHVSYDLAEELMRNAKEVKTRANFASSALDFHILYDSSASSISAIRKRFAKRTAKPYVIEIAGKADDPGWATAHQFEVFQRAVAALMQEKNGRKLLPSSQAHAVRESLFSEQELSDQDIQAQEDLWKILLAKYTKFSDAWKPVYPGANGNGTPPLYTKFTDKGNNDAEFTVFLDAIETQTFYESAGEKP